MLLNVRYIAPRNGEVERFEVIYKDDNGVVHKSDEAPDADIYIVKPEYRTYKYNKPQERIANMDKVTVPVSKIKWAISQAMGPSGSAFVDRCYREHNQRALNQLYRWPYAYACDFQPEYYYMKRWYETYPMNKNRIKLSKAFIDIETDMIDHVTDLDNIKNSAVSPVNLITVILDDTNQAYTFILKPYKPSRIGLTEEEYKERYRLYETQLKAHVDLMTNKDEFIRDLHDSFDGTYGHIEYNLRSYEKEIELIADAFRLLNDRKPNFCLIWNMRFDIQYLYYRIIALGYNPKSIMCHPDFKNKSCMYVEDRFSFKIEKQFDYFYCSSYTQYICQMRLYASIRKSQHTLKSVSLNAIGDRELRDKKVEYPAESNMTRFQYLNWALFIKYNIKDVLLQVGIERKTKDVMTYYMRSHDNMTPYNKIFKETHLLRNVREMYFEKKGWVQGNNINIIDDPEEDLNRGWTRIRNYSDDDDDDDEGEGKSSYKGAIMADPIYNDNVGLWIMSQRSNNLFNNSGDFDMAAFYPSIKIASNMDPATLIFKAAFNNEEFISGEYPNRSLNTTYFEKDKNGNIRKLDHTGEAVNTYVGNNPLTFAYNYLGIPSVTDMAKAVFAELRA